MIAYLQRSPQMASKDVAGKDDGSIALAEGQVLQISSGAELDRLLLAAGNRLVVLEVRKRRYLFTEQT